VHIETRIIKSKEAVEGYITATPGRGLPAEEQAGELFAGVRNALRSHNLRLLQERVFCTKNALPIARKIRARVYGPLDDGLEPSWLLVPEGITGQIAGVQVHAVGGKPTELLRLNDTPCGRVFRRNGSAIVTLSNISAPLENQPVKQARLAFEKAESVLKQVNADMLHVPRTWMWLADILAWYDDFNAVRNRFYAERGLITNGSLNRLPASTGIGIRSHSAAACAMDLLAVIEPASPTEYFNNAGNQNSALNYGSAFSRASKVDTPAGATVFVSGTASINAEGKTVHLNDAAGQIETTIANVLAVLRQVHFRDEHVVQAFAYCKTPQVEKLFHENWRDLSWPMLTTIADVCRPELLFEMELTAAVAADQAAL
jgi:enamine deaminase RidA (YjgF/YER057c/UK114 family)